MSFATIYIRESNYTKNKVETKIKNSKLNIETSSTLNIQTLMFVSTNLYS